LRLAIIIMCCRSLFSPFQSPHFPSCNRPPCTFHVHAKCVPDSAAAVTRLGFGKPQAPTLSMPCCCDLRSCGLELHDELGTPGLELALVFKDHRLFDLVHDLEQVKRVGWVEVLLGELLLNVR